jgi:hypothetical protein
MGAIVDNGPMLITAGRPLALAACFAFLGASAVRAQVAAGTFVNIYGKLVLVTHGNVGPIKAPGYTYSKNHSDSWVLTYTKDGHVNIHCNTLKDEYIETKTYDQGPTKSITVDTVYQHEAALGDNLLPGTLEIVWKNGGERTLKMSNELWVQVKQTVTTTTEFRDGRSKSVVVVPPVGDNSWKATNWLFHLVIRDSQGGWDAVVWEPNSDDGAVTTTNDYSYYVDDGYKWLTVLATWVVSR